MIRYEIFNFIKNYEEYEEVDFKYISKSKDSKYFNICHKFSFLVEKIYGCIGEFSDIILSDSVGNKIKTKIYVDSYIDVGKKIFCLGYFVKTKTEDTYFFAPFGYSIIKDDSLLSNLDIYKPLNEYVSNQDRLVRIHDRFYVYLNYGHIMPEEFYLDYNVDIIKFADEFSYYINNIQLKDYNAQYSIDEIIPDNSNDTDKSQYKERDLVKNNSKVYLMNNSTHAIECITGAMCISHKNTFFGKPSSEVRNLQNIKIYELCKQQNIDVNNMCLARKVLTKGVYTLDDGSKKPYSKVCFIEIDWNTHQDILPIVRYLKNGDILTYDNYVCSKEDLSKIGLSNNELYKS